MPIVIKDYNWEETPTTVAINVPLKGVKKNKVDIFSTDEFLKVSFPPYIFEVLLYDLVDEETSVARLENGMVLFSLQKKVEGMWGQLCSPTMEDKPLYRSRIEENLVKAQEKAEEEVKRRNEKKRENDKYVLRKAMDLDEEERNRITAIKEGEKRRATEELEKWKEQQREAAILEKERLLEEARQEHELKETEIRRQKLLEKSKRKNNVFEKSEDSVRASGKIEVTFTPRVFPTAMRESTKHLEEEWLKKQADARRTAEIQDADLSEEERNPMFMKEKGDKFFRGGDYQSAVNAYTHAIRLSAGKMPSLYSNRAACHLKRRNLIKSVEDSSKALELLTPVVPQNAQSRCKAHVRRGTAFCELELYVEGLQDYQAALKICPENTQLQEDTERIRLIIQQSNG
ncbi:dynein axonemal assembly factor 4-like [Watersipora subatra]|uniref:dynein axonemal assembly factor 4-like n=1 Tax=Watersipora subatra TaxID=2589382 RepID=UPI00355ADE89